MKKQGNWILIVFIMTFVLSIIFSTISNLVTANISNIAILLLLLLLVIAIGILFDAIGTSALTASEATFHSMSSSKVKGAKESITLIRNSTRISSICNDVVGDVCGIISGGLGAVIAIGIVAKTGWSNTLVSVILSAVISALTVGGKAIFKKVALNNADKIIFMVGKLKNLVHLK